ENIPTTSSLTSTSTEIPLFFSINDPLDNLLYPIYSEAINKHVPDTTTPDDFVLNYMFRIHIFYKIVLSLNPKGSTYR
ncbi:15166_t:CDS:2, partial [Entrophospora sp. SA101]